MLRRINQRQSIGDLVIAARLASGMFDQSFLADDSMNIEYDKERVVGILVNNAIPLVYACKRSPKLKRILHQSHLENILTEESKKYGLWKSQFKVIGEILQTEGIEYAFIKTPFFFPYTSGNLDVLVKETDFKRVQNILRREGFVEVKNVREPHKRLFKRFENGMEVLPLHLHERVFWGGTFLDPVQVWKNFPHKTYEGIVSVLGPEDCLLTCLAHAFYENAAAKLLDLCIVKYLLRDNELNWHYLSAVAEKFGWKEGLSLSFSLLNDLNTTLFQAPLIPSSEATREEVKDVVYGSLKSRLCKVKRSHLSMPIYINIVLSKSLHYKKIIETSEFGGRLRTISAAVDCFLKSLRAHLGIVRQSPFLISFSGVDGCGKTSHATPLVNVLKSCGLNSRYIWYRFPTSTLIMRFVRDLKRHVAHGESSLSEKDRSMNKNIFKSSWAAFMWFLLNFIDACAIYNLRVRKSLLCDEIVVCDRYFTDIYVDFQAHTGQDKLGRLFLKLLRLSFKKPDLGFFLSISENSMLSRKCGEEDIAFLRKENAIYEWLHQNGLLEFVAADRDYECVSAFLIDRVLKAYYSES